jgi:hypothetical protein
LRRKPPSEKQTRTRPFDPSGPAAYTAYNFVKHLKALKWRMPYQGICKWTNDPAPSHSGTTHLAQKLSFCYRRSQHSNGSTIWRCVSEGDGPQGCGRSRGEERASPVTLNTPEHAENEGEPPGSSNNGNVKSVFPALANNIGLITVLFSCISAILSVVFVYGYLCSFDPSLIVLMQYADVINFVLLGIFLIGPILLILSFLIVLGDSGPVAGGILGSAIPIILVLAASQVASSYISNETLTIVLLAIVWSVYMYGIYLFLRISLLRKNMIGLYVTFIATITIVFLCGFMYGNYIAYTAVPRRFVIKTKEDDSRVIDDGKLILITTHHMIIKQDHDLLIVPTEHVLEFTSPKG